MTRRRAASLLAALATAAALTGCAGSPDDADAAGPAGTSAAGSSADLPSSSSATTSSSSSSSSSSPATAGTDRPDDGSSDAPAFPANTEPDTQDASADSFVTVRDIRTGRHDGFDRVVFEVAGTGTPGWDVRYVDQPSSQGSGDPVDVAGGAALQVTITGAGIPTQTGVPEFDGPDPLPGAGTETVTEVVFDATFEGTTVAFVGTKAKAPFRVYALQDPKRVVVEVRDPA